MDFLNLAQTRFSCRSYTKQPITKEMVLQLIEAGRIAPSAVNFQPWHFIVVQSNEGRDALVESYPRDWFKTAPLYIVACADLSVSWKRVDGKDHAEIDLAIAVDHISLQAVSMGLGTCWVCNFNTTILKANLNLPATIEPIAILPIGFPAEQGDSSRFETKRKQISDIVHFEKW